MIFAFVAALAAPVSLGAGSDEWSLGGMTSWRTTPLRGLWAESPATPELSIYEGELGPSRYSEPAVHAVGSWRSLTLDVSAGSEFGWHIQETWYSRYSGYRYGARAGVVLLSSRAPDDGLDLLNVSTGLGLSGWIVCCESSGGGLSGTNEASSSHALLAHVANRFWFWEPLGLDLRYEVPLAGQGWLNTVSVGMVFAARQ